MRAVFFLHDRENNEILDPKNNIERLRRIRSINNKRHDAEESDGKINTQRTALKSRRIFLR